MVSTPSSRKSSSFVNSKKAKASPTAESSHSDERIKIPSSSKSEAESSKKMWSFQELIDTMKPSREELEFRNQKSKEAKIKEKYKKPFCCTKCNKSFNSDPDSNCRVQVHPCLGVLMCQDCCDYYVNGEFSLDSDGEDKYCRWCGEGGTIFGCSKCICGFCLSCIKKHFGSKYLMKVKNDDDWKCFFCNPKPLWETRYICSLAKEMSENKLNTSSSTTKSVNTDPAKEKQSPKEHSKESPNKHLKESPKNQSNSLRKDASKFNTQILNNSIEDPAKGKLSPSQNLKETPKNHLNYASKSTIQLLSDNDSTSSLDLMSITKPQAKSSPKKQKRKLIYPSSDEEEEEEEKKEGKQEPDKKSLKSKPKRLKSSQKKTKKPPSKENFEDKKHSVLEKLERILKLSEYQLAFGVNWSSKMLKKLEDYKNIKTPEGLKDECEKIKWFFSVLSTYLVEFCNSIDSIEKSLEKEHVPKDEDNVQNQVADPAGFSTILQFLGFITNQIKTFTEKGLSLKDVLNAEVYDDNKVVGIKRISKSTNSTSKENPGKASQTSSNSENTEKEGELRLEEDESRDEDSFRLKIDQSSELQEGDDDLTDLNSSETTIAEKRNSRYSNQKKELLEILEILENA